MDIKELKNIILNGGCTKDANLKDITKKDGYIISLYGYEYTIVNKESNYNELLNKINEYKSNLKKNEYIGVWYNKDDNLIYLDKSVYIKNKYQAINQGVKNKQLSIYDIKNNTCIELLKKCYIVYKYNKLNNDIKYIKEYINIDDILKEYKIKNYNSLKSYIINNIDEPIKELLKDNYIILKDYYNINEY